MQDLQTTDSREWPQERASLTWPQLETSFASAGGTAIASSLLYFGCRNEAKDYYYRSFWERCQGEGILAAPGGLVTAFSRDQSAKVYVQHRIRDTSAQLWVTLQQVRPLSLRF